jgi:hypothetical protein
MRCLSPDDVPALLGPAGFTVNLAQQSYRTALVLDGPISDLQRRVGASPPDDIRGLQRFLEAINVWLPSDRARVLWLDHFETGMTGDDAFLLALRRGFGEARTLIEAPGHYFEAQPWREQDQQLVTPAHAAALSVLVGVASTLLLTSSDGWLIAEGCADRIEFWEGNIFFHASDKRRLSEAKTLLRGCAPVR